MRNVRSLLAWLLLGAAGLLALVWTYPRAFPFAPRGWKVTQGEAVAIALARLKDLGPPVQKPYVVAHLNDDPLLERRLQLALGQREDRQVRASGLPERALDWEIYVYAPDALRDDWTYMAEVSLAGKVLALRLRLDPEARGNPLAPAEARARADAFLVQQGIDLARYAAPEIRSQQLAARTDLVVRYRNRRAVPGAPRAAYGLAVHFAGDRLAGFDSWFDDPEQRAFQRVFQQDIFAGIGGLVVIYLAMLLLAIPFLRRYHEGEIGVRRGVQVFLVVLVLCLAAALLSVRASSQGTGIGFASRQQTTWLVALFVAIFEILPTALLAFFAWSVGESICRARWGWKLAAFDALFRGEWDNATVARSALVGGAAGCALAGGLTAVELALHRFGAWPLASQLLSNTLNSAWPGVSLLATTMGFFLPRLLALALCLVPLLVQRLGRAWGALAAIPLGAVLLFNSTMPLPLAWGLATALLVAAALIVLSLRYDLVAVLLAGALGYVLLVSLPLLGAAAPSLAAHGGLALALAVLPLLASLRYLASRKEFVYRYEDIPPHVRRIAERERQRVELETARGIQSSILPELPPRLNGVDLAHAYLPATEVGGDFYDVLALEDGRLAVAVGDVAGHGVSSGLVMSMAKSALAVQVTFNPDVAAVFGTLNRTVYQSARKRLLATLCYALLDPKSRELLYASAGHLFPYVVSPGGRVHALESIAYPLGVRGELAIQPKMVRLEPGDVLFLFSDGLVEARTEAGDDFGFDRLERSLARHAGKSVEGIRDGVLEDVLRFAGHAPREDDQTILVLKVP
jgi:stage II sporulation SpoE-like protein